MENNNFFSKSLTILFAFIIVSFCRPSVRKELDDISPTLKVVHYDRSKLKESKMYALNQVAQCNIKPENIKVAPATLTLYQRSYRTKLEAVMCRVKTQALRWHYGFLLHSSLAYDQVSLTTDVIVTPECCRIAIKSGKISKTEYGRIYKLGTSNEVLKYQYTHVGLNEVDHLKDNTDCSSSREVKLFSFETQKQRVEIEVDQETNLVFTPLG